MHLSLLIFSEDGHQQQQVAAAPGQSAGPEYSVPLTYPYPAAPKTRSPANNWHTLVFGNHQSTAPCMFLPVVTSTSKYKS